MVKVRKSPNMMSTTGRMPVIAAPSARPGIPGSEIGESSTRSVPNSSTSPASTLNGVPASATSSPITKIDGSRRISSRKASLTAWASVSSRVPWATSSVDIARPLAAPRALDRPRRRLVDGEHVLAVDLFGGNPERLGARRDRAGRDLLIGGVLVVEVVLPDVDHRQLPERGHVHHLVEEPLAERALAGEADQDPVRAA